MALITTTTPNLIGGVSQQPAALRLPNQAEEQENAQGTITEGLKKRVNTEHVGKLLSAPTGAAFWHTIYRDSTEKYAVAASNTDLRVYDIADEGAVEQIYTHEGDVAEASDFTYLTMSSADDIEMITLADYTIVLNKAIQPKMHADTTTARAPEALVFVKAGNYKTKYIVTVTVPAGTGAGTITVTYLTMDASNAANAADIQTNHIAAALHNGLTATSLDTVTYPGLSRTGSARINDAQGWRVALEGSSVWIQRKDTQDFTTKTKDSVASTNLSVLKDEVQSFVDLPTVAPNAFVMKIQGLPEEGASGTAAYYVAFRTTSDTTTGVPGTAAFEEGVWEESVAPGITYKVDSSTMPHVLIRLANGKFLWNPIDGQVTSNLGDPYTVPKWGERVAGDATTNAQVPWLADSSGDNGEKIRGMAFFADRLVFLSGTDISLSESGHYFNWFRTTVTSLVDAARISVTAAHTKVNLLNYAIPMREQLVVFSEFTQYALRGSSDGTLTPSNVWVTAATDYETSATADPVAAKRSIFAAAPRGTATLVRELFDSGSGARPQFEAVEVTAQIPTYIQGTAKKMAVSTIEDTLVVLADTGAVKNTLYIFKYMINGDERIQSAWSKFTFGGTACDIQSMDWIDQDLFLIVKRGSEVSLERLNFEEYLTDPSSNFRVLLDRRVELSTGSYDAGTDRTTFTIPYAVAAGATMQVVTRATGAGQQLSVVSATGTSVVVSGNYATTLVWVGEKYNMRYVFSRINLQSHQGRNATRPVVSSASYRLLYGTVLFEDSAYFNVAVTPKDQTAFNYKMTGKILSSARNLTGNTPLETGNFRFPLMGDYQLITVEVSSDAPLPARLISAEWESNYHTRNQRY